MTKLNMEKDIKTIELNNSVVPKPKKKLNRVPTIRRVVNPRGFPIPGIVQVSAVNQVAVVVL